MPGNYSIQVRNIDEYTFNKLNEMAEKAGMTREGYLRKMLSNYALSEEIKKVEDKYTTLVKNQRHFFKRLLKCFRILKHQ